MWVTLFTSQIYQQICHRICHLLLKIYIDLHSSHTLHGFHNPEKIVAYHSGQDEAFSSAGLLHQG